MNFNLNYFRPKIKARISKLLRLKKVKSEYNIWLKSNWNDQTFKFYYFGSYGHFFSNFLRNYNHPFHFIDIGANQGLYSIISAQNNKCVDVLSLEPVNQIFQILLENIELNNIKNITAYPYGISENNFFAEVNYNPNHSGVTSLSKINLKNDTTKIQLVNAKFFNSIKINFIHDIIVKIDVEGHELIVIKELLKLDLFKKIKYIYYECQNNLIEKKIRSILNKNNFTKFNKVYRNQYEKDIYDIFAIRS